jgi:hypothetical protein
MEFDLVVAELRPVKGFCQVGMNMVYLYREKEVLFYDVDSIFQTIR